MKIEPPWRDVFEVLEPDGSRSASQGLPLRQVTDKRFEVGATLRYVGPTGLPAELDDQVRTLPLDPTRLSDLTSVPPAVRWYVRPHGEYSPAALFHDYFLADDSPIEPEQADTYFLNMLKAVRVPTVKRLIMWSAVALRTRWERNQLLVALWLALSICGLVLFSLAAIGVGLPSVLGGRLTVLLVTAVAPLPASLLWGAQWRAALVAAVLAIWLLPASLIAYLALGAYAVVEWLVGRIGLGD